MEILWDTNRQLVASVGVSKGRDPRIDEIVQREKVNREQGERNWMMIGRLVEAGMGISQWMREILDGNCAHSGNSLLEQGRDRTNKNWIWCSPCAK